MIKMINYYLKLFAVVLSLAPSAVFPQQPIPKDAGAYERKSVTYINTLWALDESAQKLSAKQSANMLAQIKLCLKMPRFDYNPVPASYLVDFYNQATVLMAKPNDKNNLATQTLDSLAAIMQRTIVPKILDIVDLNKDMRAANLTGEQQRNSFMSDKAKTMGITMDDINTVMNSAYIMMPLIKGYRHSIRKRKITIGFDLGIILFRISDKGDTARAVPLLKKFVSSKGFGRKWRRYMTDEGELNGEDFAFKSAGKNAARNLKTMVQSIPDFQLSEQVVENDFMHVSFELGRNEGLKLDDKFQIVEMAENGDGAIITKKNGWVIVTSVGDSDKKQGYKSIGRVVAGAPYLGALLTEYPRLPLEIILKLKRFAFSIDSVTSGSLFNNTRAADAVGLGIDAQYNIGRGMDLSQLFLDFGFSVGMGSASGSIINVSDSAKVNGSTAMAVEASLVKKFYFRRMAFVAQPLIGYQWVFINTGESPFEKFYRATSSSLTFSLNAALELALSPALNIGIGAGYQMFGSSSHWDLKRKNGPVGIWTDVRTYSNDAVLDQKGVTMQLYFTWSPPGLAFDPIDMVRGKVGI